MSASPPISSLPLAISLDGSEEVPIVQGGTTKRTTTGTIAGLANTGTGGLGAFVTAVDQHTTFPNARLLTAQPGVTTITDGGPGGSITIGIGTIPLANGGTSASLTASNGGIFYSTAGAGAILAGTATARQVLLSGASTTPAWSTATYPASTAINQILYSSAANTIAGLATANSSILVTSAGGVPLLSTTLPAFTLGGAVAGGGNQINNVIVGNSTPLAGSFTTLAANTSVSSPIHAASGVFTFQSNGAAFAGSINASQQWQIGTNTTIPASINLMVSNNTAAPTPLGFTPMVLVVGADSAVPRIAVAAYNQFSSVNFVRANGTAASPTAVASGNILANFFGHGYATSGGAGYVLSAGAGFQVTATDNYTTTVAGARFDFQATPAGSASVQTSFSVGAGTMVGTTSDPGTGALLATASIKSNGATSGIGYATGAGGAVTQATSRATGVTLNTVSGAITLVSAVGSATSATFTVTDSAVAATDVVHACQKSGADKYEIFVTAVAAGSFNITFFTTGGTTTEQPVFNFAVIKAVAS